jgi:ribosomal protein L37AE/L43A
MGRKEISFIKNLTEKVGITSNSQYCPKCKSSKVKEFYFSYNPTVLECESCGYVWEAPYESNKFKRLCKKFKRLMEGNLDY